MRDAAKAHARRVVFGLDDRGRSTIVADECTDTRLVTDGWTFNHLWQATSVPSDVLADSTLGDRVEILPPPAGYTYMITTFRPDGEWDPRRASEALAQGGLRDSVVDGEIAGLHRHDTVDIGTLISGELWAISETGETRLGPGDTWVMRGTNHAWRNRAEEPAVAVVVSFGATRSPG